MMSKIGRPVVFFYTFLLTFMVLTLTLYTYFFAKNQHQWMLELVNTKMFKLPIIIYIIVIALSVSGIIIGLLYVYNRKTYSKIEEKLKNDSFINKAPESIIKREKQKLEDSKSQLLLLQEKMRTITNE